MQSSGRTLNSPPVRRANCPEQVMGGQPMGGKIALLLSASLLTGATAAAAAQPLPCASVAPEVRERVREAGACRDDTAAAVAPKGASSPSATITMKLSDGTVVRIPREISSNINDGRKQPTIQETAPPKSAPRASASAASKPGTRGVPVPASRTLRVPDLIGRTFADVGSALAEFRVDRIETASAAPAGEVLAQDPAPATLALRGSMVSLQISDGSLVGAAGAIPETVPATAAASPAAASPLAPAPIADPAPVSVTTPAPASEPAVQPAPPGRFPIVFPANAALILGAGVLLGVLLGALLMRQWHRRRMLAADDNPRLPPVSYPRQPVETGLQTEAMPHIRFAARLDPGEATIEWVADSEEVAIEQSTQS